MMAAPSAVARPVPSLGAEAATAWLALLGAYNLGRRGTLPMGPATFGADEGLGLQPLAEAATGALLDWVPECG